MSVPDTRKAPSMWQIARRPRWIAALLLALAVAAAFAALGRWQLERSVESATVIEQDSETPVPLAELADPQRGVLESEAGRVVEVTGTLVSGDYTVHTDRESGDGPSAWLVGHLATEDGASVAVALGWAPTPEQARAAIPEGEPELELVGRYLPSEGPQQSDFEAGQLRAVSVAQLVNMWHEVGDVYGGYVVSHDAWPGLGAISSPPLAAELELNWLNVFYAVEWVIFAGFAVFLWWRLVRDVWERERTAAGGLDEDARGADAEGADGEGAGA